MRRVKIINGTYGYKPNPRKHVMPVSAGGVVEVSDEEAQRLVSIGVAAYMPTDPEELHEKAPGCPAQAGGGAGEGNPTSEKEPLLEGLKNSESENDETANLQTGEAEVDDCLEIVDGHFTRESLMLMRRPDMEKLAGDLGVDISRCKNKDDIADLLVEIDVAIPAETDGEAPPMLGVEAPVV